MVQRILTKCIILTGVGMCYGSKPPALSPQLQTAALLPVISRSRSPRLARASAVLAVRVVIVE